MNLKSVGYTGLIVFGVYFILEYLIHGVMLAGVYAQTASVWRPEAEMKGMLPVMTLGQFLYALFFSVIFARGYELGKPGVGQGIRYGILIGLLTAPAYALGWYAVLPIPSSLAVDWFLMGMIENTMLGIVAGLIYRPL